MNQSSSRIRLLSVASLLVCACVNAQNQTVNSDWPCFRGPGRMGVARSAGDAIPNQWSDSENILWKTPMPGRGASSPIVWGDNVYVTAYSGYGLEQNDPHSNITKMVRHLFCIDRASGKPRWQVEVPTRDVHEHGLSKFLFLHGYASSTPVADETGVYVYFGRAGVFRYDHSGRAGWHAPIRGREHTWGSASSPILFENLVILHADPELQAIIALDKQTGREVWRARTGEGDSWSTPLIVDAQTGPELVFHHSASQTGSARIGALNPRTGASLWECAVLKDYLCPSPIAHQGVTYWLGYQKGAAVRAGGRGDVTASHVLWTIPRGTEVGTPLLHNGHLYWTSDDGGIAYCVNATTGQIVYQERFDPPAGRIYASGVLLGERIIYVSRQNGAYIVEASPKFRQLAHNRIPSDTSAFNGTPAVSGRQMFLRSDAFLYCIGKR